MKGVGNAIPRSFIVVFLGATTCWVASTVTNRAAKSCSCWGENDDDDNTMADCRFDGVCVKPKAVEVEASGVEGSEVSVGADDCVEVLVFGWKGHLRVDF